MKRFNVTIVLFFTAMLMLAQGVSQDEIAGIRAAYMAAKEQLELYNQTHDQNVPRSDMEVVSHYVIPGCGPTQEVIDYFFVLDENTETGTCSNKLYFIIRCYNVAARKFYQEFLFDERNSELLFFFQSNDAIDGTTDETHYYYTSNGIHKSIIGNAEIDEIFAARLADDLKTTFNLLLNRDF